MRWIAPLIVACSALGGCSVEDASPGAPDASPSAIECALSIALGRGEGDAFTPFAADEEVPLILGFQGFRYVDARLRARGAPADTAVLAFQITVDGHAPESQAGGAFMLASGADGASYASEVLVFFNDLATPELVGHGVRIVTRADVAGCSARDQTTIRLGAPLSCDDAGVCEAGADPCGTDAASCDAAGP